MIRNIRVLLGGVLFFAVFVAVGVLVLMPATWLLISFGFVAYPPLDKTRFIVWGALASMPVYASVLLSPRLRRWFRAAGRKEGRFLSNAAGIILWLILVFAFILSPLVLANLLVLINGSLDRSPGASHETVVLSKTRSGGGRQAISRSLRFQSWRRDASFHDLKVTERVFESARVLAPLSVTTRSGRLGQEWIASYHLHPPARDVEATVD
jgi:hypothetical protein